MQLLDQVKQIESLNNFDDIWEAFEQITKALGFDFYIYTLSNNDSNDFYYYDNYGLHDPNDENFYDPFLEFCCNSYETMFTGPEFLDKHSYLPPKALELIERGSKLGMISGIAIPIRLKGSNRYGGFNLGSTMKRVAFENHANQVRESAQLTCMLVHRHIETIMDKENKLMEKTATTHPIADSQKLQTLTKRELDILNLVSNGQSRKKCARTLSLSESTISTHIKNIYRKLGVHNRVEATKVILQKT